MENQFKLDYNGQQVQQQDFAAIGESAGLSDDRVFAELFRMPPFDGTNISRGILPYAVDGAVKKALVSPNGASGSVLVNPFRAFLGSRTTVGTDAKKNWRDIRSAIGVGSSTLEQTVNLAANSSGNPRWDLVYAAITPDVNGPGTTRKVKNATTRVVTNQAVSPALVTTVTVGVVAGTPAASPDWPAVPSDSAGTYYIVLGYVRVPNGFGAGSTVLSTDVAIMAPMLHMSNAAGAASLKVADSHYKNGGLVLTAAAIQAWGSSGTPPTRFYPTSMESSLTTLFFTFDSSIHVNGSVIDSRDWSKRKCRYVITDTIATEVANPDPGAVTVGTSKRAFGTSQTMKETSVGTGQAVVIETVGNTWLNQADGTDVKIYCDLNDGGKLKVLSTGTPAALFDVWIDFTGAA
jgi:hypothetical protein